MKRKSLATRLGVNVGLMTAILVATLAVICYLFLAKGLERTMKSILRSEMISVTHRVSQAKQIAELQAQPHTLVDLSIGHGNIYMNIYGATNGKPSLLSLGGQPFNINPNDFKVEADLTYYKWTDDVRRPMLSVTQLVRIKDNTPVLVFLTIDRTSEQDLLESILRAALIAYPLVLLLILFLAWWTVRQGLKPLNDFLLVASSVTTENLEHRLPTEDLPTELGELADGINVMLHGLDNGVRQLSQFSDDLAHELRAPITNLIGMAQVALTKRRSIEEYREALECCAEELDRISRIVSDMLFLAYVSHPAALVKFESVNLEDESMRVSDLFKLAADEKSVGLTIEGGGVVKGNRLMVQRAISNLLSNAIRHCMTGGEVKLKIAGFGEYTRLSISNPGCCIPEEHLPHLFERFYRVDRGRSRSEGGTGLGLAIVRSIMSLHHGFVSVDSTKSVTVFHLDFPSEALYHSRRL